MKYIIALGGCQGEKEKTIAKHPQAKSVEYIRKKGKGGLVAAYSKEGLQKLGGKAAQKQARLNMRVLNALGKKYGRTIVVEDTIRVSEANRGARTAEGSADPKPATLPSAARAATTHTDQDGVVHSGVANGYYNQNDGTVHVALDAQDGAYLFFATHELTHSLEGTEQYGALADFVKGKIGAELMDTRMQEIRESYARNGVELKTPEDAMKEVIANAVPAILSDKAIVQELVSTDRTLAERVRDFFADFWATMQEQMDKLAFDDEGMGEYAALGSDPEAVRQVWQMLDEALGGEKSDTGEGKQYSQKSRYDYSKPFSEQVDDWVAGRIPENDTLVLGGTPKLYQQIGLSNLPMTIDQTHVDYAINGTKNEDHHMGAEMLKQLPELLADPIAVITSETRGDDSVVAIVDATVNGHQMMAAIEIGGSGTQNDLVIDVNMVSSTQGRKNAITKLLENAIQKESADDIGVYYLKKAEARSLYARLGVQFPDTALQDGLNHSIFDAGSPVNKKFMEQTETKFMEQTETRQFKRWFGDSKVSNDDGTPMHAYHATNSDFWTFDKGRLGKNTDWNASDEGMAGTAHLGFWFSDHDVSEQIGAHKSMDVYLSIKNPYETDLETLANTLKSTKPEALVEQLKNEGYDGLAVADAEFGGTSYVAFDETQIKSATDNIGTFDPENQDIRYSLRSTDAQGRDLTEAQTAFFADSKARDASGQLLPLYHGTENTGFTTFKQRGNLGYFFTDSHDLAKVYSGRVDQTFAPGKQDASLFEQEAIAAYTGSTEPMEPERGGIYEAYLNLTDPLELDAKGAEWDKVSGQAKGDAEEQTLTTDEWVERAYELGYDGLIVRDVQDGNDERNSVYVAFEPGQIKSVNNTEPTNDPDMDAALRTLTETCKAALENNVIRS